MKYKKCISKALYILMVLVITYFSMVGISYIRIYKNAKNTVEVDVQIIGEKNPEGKGYEARILEIREGGYAVDLKSTAEGSSFFYEGGMLVGYDGKLNMSLRQYEDLSITFLKHPWSGMVKVTIAELGIEETFDLYAPSNATTGFRYQWDRNVLLNYAYRLNGFNPIEFIVALGFLVLIVHFCLLIMKKFFRHISDKSLKIAHLFQMAGASFVICLLSLYSMFRIFRWGLILIIFVVLASFLYRIRKILEDKPHYMYASIYVVAAVMMLFLLPPGHVPDESYHYIKVYEESVIGDSHVENGVNIHLPKAIDRFISLFMANNTTKNVKYDLENYYYLYSDELIQDDIMESVYYFGNTANINKTSYLVGIALQLLLNCLRFPPILCIQLIRFAHLLISYILCYIFVQKIPDYKRLLTLIMLLPLTVQQSFGINQDWITNLVCFAIITYVLWVCEQKQFQRKDFLVLLFLSFLLGNVKIGYFAVMLLIFTIPHEKFSNKKQEYLTKILILVPCVICTMHFYIMGGQRISSTENYVNYNISFVFQHPLRTIFIYINTLLESGYNLFLSGLISGFGWFTHYTKNLLIGLESTIFIFMILGANEGRKSNISSRLMYAGIFAATSTLIFTSLFVGWTRAGLMEIAGLQARYFIVPLLCFSIMVQNSLVRFEVKYRNFYYAAVSLAILTNGVITIARGFYY